MKVVVTGGAGMIGSNLCARLLRAGHHVIAIDNLWRGTVDNLRESCAAEFRNLEFVNADLASMGSWISVLRDADCVYHLADIVAGIGYVFKNEAEIFRKNLLINATVGSAVDAMRVKRFVYVGTACSFPLDLQFGTDAPPMREGQQFPANPESAYGWSKLMGELDAAYLGKHSGIPSVILSLHNVYGTPCDFQGPRAQALPAMVYRSLQASKEGRIFTVWGDGSQGRAFVHVNDVVDALISSLDRGDGCGVIQIGPSVCTSIRDAATTIVRLVDPELQIAFDRSKPTGDRGRCADYSKASRILGWSPKIKLEDGLIELINWIKSRDE